MSLEFKSPTTPVSSPKKPARFTLGSVVSPTKKRVMISMPCEAFLNRVALLDEKLKKAIFSSFSFIFSHPTQRNASGQGNPDFFLHSAATGLYEVHTGNLIKGKDHSLKGGSTFHLIKKTLKLIDKSLKETLSAKDRETLLTCQATLIAHQNALIANFEALPGEKKDHLEKFQHIIAPTQTALSPRKMQRLQTVHVVSPSKATPKKTTLADRRSIAILQGKNPDEVMPQARVIPNSPQFTTEKNPSDFSKAKIPTMPRALLVKYQQQQSALKKVAKDVPTPSPKVKPTNFT